VVPALLILILAAAGTSSTSAADEYVFVEDTERSVTIIRGEYIFVGKLDSLGEFTEHSRRDKNSPGSVSNIICLPRLKPYAAYE
jgi:hypothetical protein